MRHVKCHLPEQQEQQKFAFEALIGTDEAGRGPLAGPVMAAAVYLTPEQESLLLKLGLRDSKKMTPHARERVFAMMQELGVLWRAQAGSVERIDRMNILQASLWAMGRSVERLLTGPLASLQDSQKNEYCLIVDGPMYIPSEYLSVAITQKPVIQADRKVPAVSAASVVAKVLRDRVMIALDRLYPEYGFARHKGYPTLMHRETIAHIGLSPVHRHSFCRKYEQDERQLLIDGCE